GGTGNMYPIWSPDGRFVVFGTAGGLFWTRADGGGNPKRLTESKFAPYPGSFTPDGKWLAYFDQSSGTGADIWTVPIENVSGELRAGKPELFLKSPNVRSYPVFSPDGHWLAYASTESGGYEVYVRAFPDNGERTRISSSGGMHPAWSRNGHELFYR